MLLSVDDLFHARCSGALGGPWEHTGAHAGDMGIGENNSVNANRAGDLMAPGPAAHRQCGIAQFTVRLLDGVRVAEEKEEVVPLVESS